MYHSRVSPTSQRFRPAFLATGREGDVRPRRSHSADSLPSDHSRKRRGADDNEKRTDALEGNSDDSMIRLVCADRDVFFQNPEIIMQQKKVQARVHKAAQGRKAQKGLKKKRGYDELRVALGIVQTV